MGQDKKTVLSTAKKTRTDRGRMQTEKGNGFMASSREYLDFIMEQLSGLKDISFRAMMGEYILYYRGKVVGGIYDDRFLVKPTVSAAAMMPNAERELPYEGAKEMLLVDNVDNQQFLRELIEKVYGELPEPKKKSKQKNDHQ